MNDNANVRIMSILNITIIAKNEENEKRKVYFLLKKGLFREIRNSSFGCFFSSFRSAGENMVADDGENGLGVEPGVACFLRIPVVKGAAGGVAAACGGPGRVDGGLVGFKMVKLSVVYGGKLIFLIENAA